MPDEFSLLADAARDLGVDGPPPRVRRAAVDTPDGRVSALLWGDRPRVTFLHGAALNAHTWDATALRLGWPALVPDLPGHGDSDWRPDFDYSPRTVAPALAVAVAALGGDRPQMLVGQSLGGLAGLAVAELRPDLVRAIVLVDVTPSSRQQDAGPVRSFLSGSLVFSSRAEVADLAVAAGIAEPGPALDRGVLYNTRLREDGSVVFKHHFGTPPPGAGAGIDVDFGDLWSVLEAAAVPVLLVRATRGYLSDAAVTEFSARAPRARIVEIDARHNVQDHRPAELAGLVAGFTAG